MRKELILKIISEQADLSAGESRYQMKKNELTLEEIDFYCEASQAKARLMRAEEEPKLAEEHRGIAALIAEQCGFELSEIEAKPEEIEEKQEEKSEEPAPTILIHLKETGHIDIAVSRESYLLAGRPRREMLTHLAAKVAAVCDDLGEEELDEQIRLAANAIMLPGERSYRGREAFWKSRKELHKDF